MGDSARGNSSSGDHLRDLLGRSEERAVLGRLASPLIAHDYQGKQLRLFGAVAETFNVVDERMDSQR